MIRYGLWPEIIIFNENLSDFRDFCATFLGGQEDGLVHVQMQKKKRVFLLYSAHLIVPLRLDASKLLTFGKSKEKVFSFVFRSLNRNFEPMALRYSRSGMQKKNEFSFCIPLT